MQLAVAAHDALASGLWDACSSWDRLVVDCRKRCAVYRQPAPTWEASSRGQVAGASTVANGGARGTSFGRDFEGSVLAYTSGAAHARGRRDPTQGPQPPLALSRFGCEGLFQVEGILLKKSRFYSFIRMVCKSSGLSSPIVGCALSQFMGRSPPQVTPPDALVT